MMPAGSAIAQIAAPNMKFPHNFATLACRFSAATVQTPEAL